jgi:hypothetical protein
MCIYMHEFLLKYIYLCSFEYTYMYMHIFEQKVFKVRTGSFSRTSEAACYRQRYLCIHLYKYVYMCMYLCIYVYVHVHIHVDMCIHV